MKTAPLDLTPSRSRLAELSEMIDQLVEDDKAVSLSLSDLFALSAVLKFCADAWRPEEP